ncbi:MAG: hypothetical protein ACFFD1_03780 [Candidatus Thorarchaeota archaeon]
MSQIRNKSDDEIKYGPNKPTTFIGIAFLIVGIFILGQLPAFIFLTLIDNSFNIGTIFTSLVENWFQILLSIFLLIMAYWFLDSGSESLVLSNRLLIHKKFFFSHEYFWRDQNKNFFVLIRSSQPELRGRRGLEAWQVEIHLKSRNNNEEIKINVPDMKKEADIVLFLRYLKKYSKSEFVGHRDIDYSIITGKNQRIEFEIQRKSVKELQKDSRKYKIKSK